MKFVLCVKDQKNHTHEELLACMKKMSEFKDQTQGGAGIE